MVQKRYHMLFFSDLTIDWMCLPKCIHWNLTPNGMIFQDEAFGRELGDESRALVNGFSAPKKESSFFPSPCEDKNKQIKNDCL